MKKFLLFAMLSFSAAVLSAADLFDLRVFPDFDNRTIHVSGTLSRSSLKEEPLSRRNLFSGLLGRWLASGTVKLASDNTSVVLPVNEGEFSGTLKVVSLASFTVNVIYDGQNIYSESFWFPEKADFIVVSDIDDTILVTEVNSRLKMTYNSLFKSVRERKPVPGTPELYQLFKHGASRLGIPHFIYLSSSPAFLSRTLKHFINSNAFPQGTLILKKSLTSGGHESHKSGWLKKITQMYSDKPVILFGDSGEKDPLIYRSFFATSNRPELIKGIIIHEIAAAPQNTEILEQTGHFLSRNQIPFIYWKSIESLKNFLREKNLLKENY